MHKEILTKEQIELLSLLQEFSKDFILVGGTAIALHLGHRRSIDFDLFSNKKFNNRAIYQKINRYWKIDKTYLSAVGEYTLMVNKIKMTFFEFGHIIEAVEKLDKIIRFPDLLTLAAMKSFVLGFRGKWKDYVDLYFIIRDYYSVEEISKKAQEIFKGEFNERILREQLAYFDDINYREAVEFLPGLEVSEKEIKKKLVEFSLE
ncbi:MAG: hypothetical protein CO002_04850 [Candidatus Portnoybacteria bacterium CG_4_8_14_3_um_filter_44_10]|uniref:Nucleotidyl transferase AbiEii/AbiGii toxin family protein n=5 Tax=Candidatus Portnoyibacteriota TaxID=1817913 RepID=A0A2H0KP47_9BACT|nr:MAG: hypothetical protein COV85_05010 [Candidatus Portnoybacteria bacterium CG11_big_fil_rev_8_21_14_0_20_44_10]PIS16755.1 MAG: hypothetical protein COT61_02255 [Candidatus Portnoybacteria bacterium CG09_land_8_20_14_0_10_44_13]PIW74932.1 MAG: hypothetical protein CO002_04850 [Candidatus Portnoybacteria bacterium CG_4_8_14_3_um_filter_44_10]PIZ69003.1 MAG: hypothetical protein COY11_05190 [Candidatus Portnoybacteria bacterium CG_4_10_14_0_2_um_filter_44_20]PJA63355.1 MAG: hypothetical protei